MKQTTKKEIQDYVPNLSTGEVLKIIINPSLYKYHAYIGSERAADTYSEDEDDT